MMMLLPSGRTTCATAAAGTAGVADGRFCGAGTRAVVACAVRLAAPAALPSPATRTRPRLRPRPRPRPQPASGSSAPPSWMAVSSDSGCTPCRLRSLARSAAFGSDKPSAWPLAPACSLATVRGGLAAQSVLGAAIAAAWSAAGPSGALSVTCCCCSLPPGWCCCLLGPAAPSAATAGASGDGTSAAGTGAEGAPAGAACSRSLGTPPGAAGPLAPAAPEAALIGPAVPAGCPPTRTTMPASSPSSSSSPDTNEMNSTWGDCARAPAEPRGASPHARSVTRQPPPLVPARAPALGPAVAPLLPPLQFEGSSLIRFWGSGAVSWERCLVATPQAPCRSGTPGNSPPDGVPCCVLAPPVSCRLRLRRPPAAGASAAPGVACSAGARLQPTHAAPLRAMNTSHSAFPRMSTSGPPGPCREPTASASACLRPATAARSPQKVEGCVAAPTWQRLAVEAIARSIAACARAPAPSPPPAGASSACAGGCERRAAPRAPRSAALKTPLPCSAAYPPARAAAQPAQPRPPSASASSSRSAPPKPSRLCRGEATGQGQGAVGGRRAQAGRRSPERLRRHSGAI
jgi:hypothetical protein